MIYYPKTKILENQYTSGKEFVFKKNNKPYTGYYYALSNNTFFTGKNSQTVNSEELIRVSTTQPSAINNVEGINVNVQFKLPAPYYPTPSDKDFQLGFITRYFVKRRNSDYTTIREISPNDYNIYFSATPTFDTNLYVATKINWRIGNLSNKSEIESTNKKLVELKERIFPGFKYWFKNYSQFSV